MLHPRRIVSYAVAKAGPRSEDISEERLRVCRECPFREVVGDEEFCLKCGCGRRPDAELKTKTAMKWATCPKGKWIR